MAIELKYNRINARLNSEKFFEKNSNVYNLFIISLMIVHICEYNNNHRDGETPKRNRTETAKPQPHDTALNTGSGRGYNPRGK